jgi:DNA-binding FadR family transcriptional regulator
MAQETPPVRSITLGEQVTRALAARIVNGEIGARRPPPTESDICAEFGVSKTTAREVIRALAARGFVEVRHGRRMRVREATEWNQLDPLVLELSDDPKVVRRYLRELHDVRMLLEPEIAARAATSASDEQIEELRMSVEMMARLEGDADAYLEVDVAFHRELAAATGNFVLTSLLDSVAALQRVSRKVTNRLRGRLKDATREHRRIVDAVAAHRPEAARRAMRAHLQTVAHIWIPGTKDAQIEAVIRGTHKGGRR